MNLHIHMFGTFHLTRGPCTPVIRVNPSIQPLLAFLIVFHDRPHSAICLAERFWPDKDSNRARRCLSTALWRLRTILESADPNKERAAYISGNLHNGIQFNLPKPYWWDAKIFEQTIGNFIACPSVTAISSEEVTAVEKALSLYTNDFLVEIDTDWALQERERFRLMRFRALTQLMHWHREHEALDKSIQYGHMILQEDPLQEEVHQELMKLYVAAGRPSRALHQYEVCQHILAQELNIPPAIETQSLLSELSGHRQNSESISPSLRASNPPQNKQKAVQEVKQAWREYQRAYHRLDSAMRDLLQFLDISDHP